MANPTTYFGWVMPNSADLVTDLPADFAVFGQGVDTSMQDLLGGTTGQVLSKTSGTNMDFTWINNDQGDITAVTAGTGISGGGTSGAVTITNDMATTITAAGDIVIGTGSGTYDNLPIGTTAQVLTADTTVSPYKVKWATAGGGGKVLQVVSGTTTTDTTIASNTYTDTTITATITPTSATSKILVLIQGSVYYTRSATGNTQNVGAKLLRGSTSLMQNDYVAYTEFAGTTAQSCAFLIPITYIDSPSTTSATTYKLQGRLQQLTTGSSIWQHSSTLSTITLLEIGA